MIDERIPKEYIITITQDGKEKKFVSYRGLLYLVHKYKPRRVETELVQIPAQANGNVAVIKATVENEWGTFVEHGDASPDNVNPEVASHLISVACTRAKSRAIRDAYNVRMVTFEELTARNGQAQASPKMLKDQINELIEENPEVKDTVRAFLDDRDKTFVQELTSDEALGLLEWIKESEKNKREREDAKAGRKHGYAA